MKLTDMSAVKDLLSRYGIVMKKKYGQNFLINEAIPRRIAEAGASEGCAALEIGPGIGCLTAELAAVAAKVVAVEIDPTLWPVLDETMAPYPNVKILHGDILKTDLSALLREEFKGYAEVRVCANLPYYITSPILMYLLESGVPFTSITVMVQKEVADRLCAAPGSPEYGAITAAVAWRGQAKRCFVVAPGNFFPAPSVDSAVVRIDLFSEPPCAVSDEKLLFRVIRGAFGQRRKTLPNALSAALGEFSKAEILAAIERAGFPAAVRGETLSVQDFAALTNELTRGRG